MQGYSVFSFFLFLVSFLTFFYYSLFFPCHVNPANKLKAKNIKISPVLGVFLFILTFCRLIIPILTAYQPGSKAILSLLSQVNAALEAHQLSADPSMASYAKLHQYYDAVNLASQQ